MTITATAPAAPPASEAGPAPRPAERRRKAIAFGLLVSAQFVVMLDTSIVNVALPSIQADLALGPAGLTWVVNAYVLAFGGLLLLSGRAADLFGRRKMFVAGSATFTVGTLLAAAAADQWLLLAGRLVQGVGAAALSPAAMSLLLVTFTGPARAKAMSIWGAASAVGGATGVFLGGVLCGSFGWSSVFLVTVPVSVLAVVSAHWVLDEPARAGRRGFDWRGAASSTGAVVALVHAALGAARGAWSSPSVWSSFVVFLALAAAFVRIERRATDPLVPLELFRSRILSNGVWLALLGGSARASTFVLVALYLQQALHLAPQRAGLAMVPTSITGLVVSLMLLPRALSRLGTRHTLVAGLVVLAAGQLWLAFGPLGSSYLVTVLPGLLLVATGVALSFTPTTMVIAAALPDTHMGLASGMAGSSTQVGAALGTAGLTAVGLAVSGAGAGVLSPAGFTAAFTAAAVLSLVAAAVGRAFAGRPS